MLEELLKDYVFSGPFHGQRGFGIEPGSGPLVAVGNDEIRDGARGGKQRRGQFNLKGLVLDEVVMGEREALLYL